MPKWKTHLIKVFPFFLLCLSIGLWFSCASQLHLGWQQWLDVQFDKLPSQNDYPEAGALFLVDEARLEITYNNEQPRSVVHRHTAIKILNQRGFQYANVIIPYEMGTRITHIKAHTLLADGREISLLPNQIYDTNLDSDIVYYSDTRAKRFSMPAVEAGCIVEYSWRKTVDHFSLWTYWPFQREEPVLLSKYSVVSPVSLKYQYQVYPSNVPIEEKTNSLGRFEERIWEAHHAPAFVPETLSPPGNTALSHILFTPLGVESWQDVADWYDQLSSQQSKPTREITQLVHRLVQDTKTQKERLQKLYEYVRDNIRYMAITVGVGGYRPHAAGTVLRNSFGDCKDMVTLLTSMGKIAGLKIYPALISTWFNGEVDSGLVSPTYFNHVIAWAQLEDGSEFWLDPTEKQCPFSALPWYDQNCLTLIIGAEKVPQLKRTSKSSVEENLSERQWQISFDANGMAKGNFVMNLHGAQAMEFRRQMQQIHPSNRYTWVSHEVFSHYPITLDTTVTLASVDSPEMPLTVYCKFFSPHIIYKSQDLYTLFPDAMSTFDWHRLFPSPNRRYDIVIRHPLEMTDRIAFTYPPEWTCVLDIFGDSIVGPFGSYQWHLDFVSPGQAVMKRTFRLTATHIKKTEYKAFRKFLNNIALSEQTLILFSAR